MNGDWMRALSRPLVENTAEAGVEFIAVSSEATAHANTTSARSDVLFFTLRYLHLCSSTPTSFCQGVVSSNPQRDAQ
jgi:hypothetical protein